MTQTPLAVERLVQIAEQPLYVRGSACTALQQIRDPAAMPALAAAAQSSEWEVRQAAAAALGATGRPEAFHVLELLASDDDYDVREAAARALSLIDLRAAVPVLGRLARDKVRQVRSAALEALNSRYPHLAGQELLALAGDESYPERVRVVRSLGRHADPHIEEELNNLLASPDKNVRGAAAEALQAHRASAGRQKRLADRFNPFRQAKGRLMTWLQLDGYLQLIKEERTAGVPESMVINTVNARIAADAELTHRYRRIIRLYFWLFVAFATFGLFVVWLACRFSLWSAAGMLGEWPYFAGLLAK
jgi:hypothetical protein